MNKLSLNSKVSINTNVAFTQIDDNLVMMGPNNNLFYGVNSVGTAIWALLELKTLSLSEICEYIHQQYDVTKAQCIEDSTRFLEEMVDQHMLVVAQ